MNKSLPRESYYEIKTFSSDVIYSLFKNRENEREKKQKKVSYV